MTEFSPFTAIIGGSGLAKLSDLKLIERQVMRTPYGEPSSPVISGLLNNVPVRFLARHGHAHTIAPHKVNYRANLWALKDLGIKHVIAVGAVGAINNSMSTGSLILPDQLIDYTWGREHTYYDGSIKKIEHVDFTQPYSPAMRKLLIESARAHQIELVDGAVYAAMQGPRLETAAEIGRLKNDGCDLVGMTGMPEAALARELGLNYVAINLVVNAAAGIDPSPISMKEIDEVITLGIPKVIELIASSLGSINQLAN